MWCHHESLLSSAPFVYSLQLPSDSPYFCPLQIFEVSIAISLSHLYTLPTCVHIVQPHRPSEIPQESSISPNYYTHTTRTPWMMHISKAPTVSLPFCIMVAQASQCLHDWIEWPESQRNKLPRQTFPWKVTLASVLRPKFFSFYRHHHGILLFLLILRPQVPFLLSCCKVHGLVFCLFVFILLYSVLFLGTVFLCSSSWPWITITKSMVTLIFWQDS